MKPPLVSIVLPTFNRAYCLRRAVGSVLAQTYSNWELIVVDDGSTDGTASIRLELASILGERYREVLTKNVGPALARNLGIEVAKGTWVAFQDSDDVWRPEKLAMQMDKLENNSGCLFNFTDFFIFDDALSASKTGHSISHDLEGTPYPALLEIRHNVITCPSVVVRRDILLEVGGFDASMRVCEDIDLWARIGRRTPFSVVRVPLIGVHHRSADRFPYSSSLRGRVALYRNVIARDPGLKGSHIESLFDEALRTFYDVSVSKQESAITAIFDSHIADRSKLTSGRVPSLDETMLAIAASIDAHLMDPR